MLVVFDVDVDVDVAIGVVAHEKLSFHVFEVDVETYFEKSTQLNAKPCVEQKEQVEFERMRYVEND